ncbi:MAG: GNAT family N-acetyltransferase, partial [Cytophagales bacterium]|nr:GNAT family N-acetyltransferase [Cytophagales bacterium]
MRNHVIKKASELTAPEIGLILHYWEIEEWAALSEAAFKDQFRHSEFHLLTGEGASLLALARLNFDFRLEIEGRQHQWAEFVGFVAAQPRRGYGSALLAALVASLQSRGIEALGFCEEPVRPFYEQCKVGILYDQARYLREKRDDWWGIPPDDDILDLSLSGA